MDGEGLLELLSLLLVPDDLEVQADAAVLFRNMEGGLAEEELVDPLLSCSL